MYNLVEYGKNYSKRLGSLWQYYRDEEDNSKGDSKSKEFKHRFIDKIKKILMLWMEK